MKSIIVGCMCAFICGCSCLNSGPLTSCSQDTCDFVIGQPGADLLLNAMRKANVVYLNDGDRCTVVDRQACVPLLVTLIDASNAKIRTSIENMMLSDTSDKPNAVQNPVPRRIVQKDDGSYSVLKMAPQYIQIYEPYSVAADEIGYVKYPNINLEVEMIFLQVALAERRMFGKLLLCMDPTANIPTPDFVSKVRP